MTMRKALPENKHNVRHHRSWFTWWKCGVCSNEYRREKGFLYDVQWGMFTVPEYICASCGCHSQDFVYVNKYIDYMISNSRLKSQYLPMPKVKPTLPAHPPMRPIGDFV